MRSILLGLVALTTIGAIIITRAYRLDIDAARQHAAADSHIVETPCGRIEYAAVGEGVPALVVHGAGGGFDQALYFAMPLTRRGFRIIAMSRFGYLRTPLAADASAQAQARAHACLLDALQIRRANGGHLWVGHQEQVMSAIERFLKSQPPGDVPAAGSSVH